MENGKRPKAIVIRPTSETEFRIGDRPGGPASSSTAPSQRVGSARIPGHLEYTQLYRAGEKKPPTD